ncbi:TIGR01777 family oxidoreductase [Pseudoalteromonas mariniglutinosa]|uniref:TIGR01777 family oxidoreductase n=1 Tax=Pseudoalteromonas mariniglutinosa TaxID=206042 RepID=UPI003850B636
MHIFITGGTGLIGKHLCPFLLHHHHVTVLSRNPTKANILLTHNIEAVDSLNDVDFNSVDVVINLAGEPIVNKRWSNAQKQNLVDSRIKLTKNLANAIKNCEAPPHTFISGSAIGYYGRQSNELIDESFNDIYPEFSHVLCRDWEHAALKAQSSATRVCLLRTGIVLAKQGGALAKMLPPFKFAVGGPIADGKQGMSWIHIDDMIQLILFIIKHHEISGPINATAPNPVDNNEFSYTLANVISRPAMLRMPKWMIRLMMGEMADLLLYGQFVVPKKVLDHQYRFHYPELKSALESLKL